MIVIVPRIESDDWLTSRDLEWARSLMWLHPPERTDAEPPPTKWP